MTLLPGFFILGMISLSCYSAVGVGMIILLILPLILAPQVSSDLLILSGLAAMTLPVIGALTLSLLFRAAWSEGTAQKMHGPQAGLGALLAMVGANQAGLPIEFLEVFTGNPAVALAVPFVVGWIGSLMFVAASSALIVLSGSLLLELPLQWLASTGRVVVPLPFGSIRLFLVVGFVGLTAQAVGSFFLSNQFFNGLLQRLSSSVSGA